MGEAEAVAVALLDADSEGVSEALGVAEGEVEGEEDSDDDALLVADGEVETASIFERMMTGGSHGV